jgi:hypothetical protein
MDVPCLGKPDPERRYAEPGDRLWVRETFALWDGGQHARRGRQGVSFRADCLTRSGAEDGDSARARHDFGVKWRPSIFMPRWASRLTLEVTSVRVERLHEISEEDACAEGMMPEKTRAGGGWRGAVRLETAREAFKRGWDSINGKRAAWASNPWCWVVGFQRVEQACRAA